MYCIQDTLLSRAALGLPAVQPLGRVRRASKGILHTKIYRKVQSKLYMIKTTIVVVYKIPYRRARAWP